MQEKSSLAVNGGAKSIEGFEGKPLPKTWNEEFLKLARLWGYSDSAMAAIEKVVAQETPPSGAFGGGPFFGRYANPGVSNVSLFEEEAKKFLDVSHAYAVSSGTAALHSSFIAADVCCGDEVIIPAYTFCATAMAAVVAGGIPIWCEVDESMTMDPEDLRRKITPRTKVVVPVHMNGYVCDMDAIMSVAREHNLTVIEDCAQAFGASYRGRRVGTIGDFGCYSISSFKVTGGGEAGMLVTNNEELFARAQGFAESGGLWRPNRFGPPRWDGEIFCGLNYRQSELEGTINLVQVGKAQKQLDQWRANRRAILGAVPAYDGLQLQRVHDLDGEMNYSFGLLPDSNKLAKELRAAFSAEGVPAGLRGDNPDWHYADNMPQVNEQISSTSDGFPWQNPQTLAKGGPPPKSDDPCPKTSDLSRRHLKVTIEKWWTTADCANIAGAITKVLDAYFTRLPDTTMLDVALNAETVSP